MRFDNNKYSVLSTAIGWPVGIQAYADRIVIRQDGVVVGEHSRDEVWPDLNSSGGTRWQLAL
ncbi:hypothetical protein MesoLj113a_72430 [Mesorhizobium sp. 113-1-2]|nr:hypothetical protein MesoLj113a_72430 [Mesorhizobium sp. 113-1-2]